MAAKTDNEKMEGPGIGADALASRVGLRIPRLDLDAARRRALLVKVGKGTAALAVLAPLSAHASGTHKLYNPSLPGYGYCTVSGFQSAVVSGAPVTCSASAPSSFLTTLPLDYSGMVSGTPNAKKLATALNTKFSLPTDFITDTQVSSTLLASPLKNLVVTGKNLVIYAVSTSAGVSLQPKSFPAAITNSLAAFKSAGLFTNSADTRTLLEVLYDGVVSSSPATAKCYFLSAYLTVYSSTPSNLPQGFDKAYVTGQYSDGNAASGTDVYQFFKALCGA